MFYCTARAPSTKTEIHSAIPVAHKLYCFGRKADGSSFNFHSVLDVHVFNTVSLRWVKVIPVPTGRGELEAVVRPWGHTALLVDQAVYLWGGWAFADVLYAFDVDAHRWFKPSVNGTLPPETWRHSACGSGKIMYIYGGFKPQTLRTNDMYKLDTSTMVWSLINTRGTRPPASDGHSATVIGTLMFVFGGTVGVRYANETENNDIRVFDTENDLWLSTPSAQRRPKERRTHLSFAYNGELYIYGGIKNTSQYFNDMWKCDPKTFSWKEVMPRKRKPYPQRALFCWTSCIVGDRIIFWDEYDGLHVLDLSPSLKTFCQLAVVRFSLDQSGLPYDIRWELEAMTGANRTGSRKMCRIT